MPSGKVHDNYWKKLLPVGLASSIFWFFLFEYTIVYVYPYSCVGNHCFTVSLLISVGVPFGYLFGRYLTPDADQANITTSEWTIMREVPVIGILFVSYWMPYGYWTTHRSKWTHSYILSSLIRVIYQFLWLPLIHVPQAFYIMLIGFWIGLSEADAIHIWFDNNFKEKDGKLKRK